MTLSRFAYSVPAADAATAEKIADRTAKDGVAVVSHGSDPLAERPAARLVWWIGSVEPLNALEDDAWTQKPSGGSVEPDAAPTVDVP